MPDLSLPSVIASPAAGCSPVGVFAGQSSAPSSSSAQDATDSQSADFLAQVEAALALLDPGTQPAVVGRPDVPSADTGDQQGGRPSEANAPLDAEADAAPLLLALAAPLLTPKRECLVSSAWGQDGADTAVAADTRARGEADEAGEEGRGLEDDLTAVFAAIGLPLLSAPIEPVGTARAEWAVDGQDAVASSPSPAPAYATAALSGTTGAAPSARRGDAPTDGVVLDGTIPLDDVPKRTAGDGPSKSHPLSESADQAPEKVAVGTPAVPDREPTLGIEPERTLAPELAATVASDSDGRISRAKTGADAASSLRPKRIPAGTETTRDEPDPRTPGLSGLHFVPEVAQRTSDEQHIQVAGGNGAQSAREVTPADVPGRSETPALEDGQAPSVAAPPGAVHDARPVSDVQAPDIVAQIANEAHVYRLAGGRRVRLQLQPEGLGGVEVTIRYGASQRLELHVVVEHAETGSLVEQGWSQLRDALSAQGLATERLVVSVAGPALGDTSPAIANGREAISGEGAAFGSGLPSSGGHDRGDQRGGGHFAAAFGHTREHTSQEQPSAGHEKASRIDYRV